MVVSLRQKVNNIIVAGTVFLRAEQPDLPALGQFLFGDFGIVCFRPAFGGAKLGTGTECQNRASAIGQVVFLAWLWRLTVVRIGDQSWLRQRIGSGADWGCQATKRSIISG